MYLTKNELEIMDVLWEQGRPLSRGELLTLPEPYTTLNGSLARATVPVDRLLALLAPIFVLAASAVAAPVPPYSTANGSDSFRGQPKSAQSGVSAIFPKAIPVPP